jgi:hypothetical protein
MKLFRDVQSQSAVPPPNSHYPRTMAEPMPMVNLARTRRNY